VCNVLKKVDVVLGYAASLVHNWLTSYQFMLLAVAVFICNLFLLIYVWRRACSHRSVLRDKGSYGCVTCWTVGGWLISVSSVTDEVMSQLRSASVA